MNQQKKNNQNEITKIYRYWKRFIAFFMVVLILFSMDGMTNYGYIFASAADEDGYPIYLNGALLTEDGLITVEYGQELVFSSDDKEIDNTSFMYLSKTDLEAHDNQLSEAPIYSFDAADYERIKPDQYFVCMDYHNIKQDADDQQVNLAYSFTVKPAEIKPLKKSDLKWDGNDAVFPVQTITTSEVELGSDDIEAYSVQLYRNGKKIGEPEAINVAAADNGVLRCGAFADKVETYGDWSFSVTAKLASAYENCYVTPLESPISEEKVVPDETEPAILNYSVISNEISATFADTESGIEAYCITDKALSDLEETDWIKLDAVDSSEEGVTKTCTPGEAGFYHLYVKDASGNINSSIDDAISVTIIRFQGEMVTSVNCPDLIFYGDDSANKDIISVVPHRSGYTFVGWYESEDSDARQITEVSIGDGKLHQVYAKWEQKQVEFDTNLTPGQNVTRDYAGQSSIDSFPVAVRPSDEYKSIVYEWYKYDLNEEGEKASELASLVDDAHLSSSVDSNHDTLQTINVDDSGIYYAIAVITTTDDETIREKSNSVKVIIQPKTLKITTDSQTIGYGEDPSEYTYTAATFLPGENRGMALTGEVTCEYVKGMDIGSYTISGEGLKAVHGNYDIEYINGILTVEPESVDASDIVVSLSPASFSYDGTAHEPSVIVTINGNAVDANEYSLTYTDNVLAGTATVLVTLNKNYRGSKTESFAITKADIEKPDFEIGNADSWVYGDEDAKHTFVSSGNISGGAETYYFRKTGESAWISERPTDAGTYKVYLEIGATENYASDRSDEKTFTIKKKPITLTAGSAEWTYQYGTNHTYNYYVKTGNLVAQDDFRFITTEIYESQDGAGTKYGSITDVGTYYNHISYELSASTNPDNYEITLVDGTLVINERVLASPSNVQWDEHDAGKATWTKIIRGNLVIQYQTDLYKLNDEGVGELVADSHKEVSVPYVDYSDLIRGAGLGKYYFTVLAVPVGGIAQNNYSTGAEVSTKNTSVISTVSVEIDYDDKGINQAGIGDGFNTSYIAIQDETILLKASRKEGYTWSDPAWNIMEGADLATLQNLSTGATDGATFEQKLVIGNEEAIKAASGTKITLHVSVTDEVPVLELFDADYVVTGEEEDLTKVRLHMVGSDSKQLTGWMITTDSEKPAKDSSDWKTEGITGGKKIDTQIEVSVAQVGTGLTYYAWVKDDEGNIEGAEADALVEPISLYRIDLKKGDANAVLLGASVKESLIKISDKALTLPAVPYSYDGYAFQYWLSEKNKHHYEDQEDYAENQNDVLTATWTINNFDYSVEYYLMKSDGSYSETADNSIPFTGTYNQVVRSSDAKLQLTVDGFTRDIEKDDEIVLTSQDKVLKIYYMREKREITYTYWVLDAEGNEVAGPRQTLPAVSYYYNQAIEDKEKPTMPGYTFVGWFYNGSAAKPASMPNENIAATGYFRPNMATYTVNYYFETLETPGVYALDTEGKYRPNPSDVKNALHNQSISYELSEAPELEGFTAKFVGVTYGVAGGATPADTTVANGAATIYDENHLHINVYYTRNLYDVSLKVFVGDRNSGNILFDTYVVKKVPYETVITSEQRNEWVDYKAATWKDPGYEKWSELGFNSATYVLADYADWSTGIVPTKMPAGDIVITREYVTNNNDYFQVEIYYETAEENVYALETTLTYYGNNGALVELVPNAESPSDADMKLPITEFTAFLTDLKYYEFSDQPGRNTDADRKGVIVSDKSGSVLTLKVYFERKTEPIIIRYRQNGKEVEAYQETVNAKWGQKVSFDVLKYFDCTIGETTKPADGKTGTYRYENYLVSYEGRYALPNKEASEGYKVTWPNEQYKTPDLPTEKLEYTMGAHENVGDYTNYLYINYDQVDSDKTYYVDMLYDDEKLVKNSDTSKAKPLTIRIDDKDYQVRVANWKDVLGSKYNGLDLVKFTQEQWDAYPAAKNIVSNYTTKTNASYNPAIHTNIQEKTYHYKDAAGVARSAIVYTEEINGTPYVYLLDENNQFYPGNRASFRFTNSSYNKYLMGCNEIRDIIAAYQLAHKDPSDEGSYDKNWNGLYIYDGSFSKIEHEEDSKSSYPRRYTYTIHIDVHDGYKMYYNLNGNTATYEYGYHELVRPGYQKADGAKLIAEDEKFSGTIPYGYVINWYTDAALTKSLDTDTTFEIGQNYVYYGRYEKKLQNDNYEYVHFQLANELTIGEGGSDQKIKYITKDNLEVVKEALGDNLVCSEVEETIPYTDEFLRKKTAVAKIKTYSIDGNVVLICRQRPALAFTTLKIAENEAGTVNAYQKAVYDAETGNFTDGKYTYDSDMFYLDETNPANKSYAYCEGEALNLDAYYARYTYTLTIDKQDSPTVNNLIETTRVNGETIILEAPEKEGYLFAGWTLASETVDSEGKTVLTNLIETELSQISFTENKHNVDIDGVSVPVVTDTSFVMPKLNLRATANWKSGFAGENTVTYFYQKVDGTYYEDGLAKIREAVAAGEDQVKADSLQGKTIKKYYSTAEKLLGISCEVTIDGKKITAYFAPNAKGEASFDPDLLMAMEYVTSEFVTEKVYEVTTLLIPAATKVASSECELYSGMEVGSPEFTFERTAYVYQTTMEAYGKDGSFTAYPGMTLDCYYTRKADYVLSVEGVCSDLGAKTGISVVGDGTYDYGESVDLQISTDIGYTFIGLYNKADLYDTETGKVHDKYLTEYVDGTKEINIEAVQEAVVAGTLKDYSVADADNYRYQHKIREDELFVALTFPDDIASTTVVISTAKDEYIYGYKVGAGNTIKAEATISGNDIAKNNTKIDGYKWYEIGLDGTPTEIGGATSSSYVFPAGKNVGNYKYYCEVELERSDNGRTHTVSSNIISLTVRTNQYAPVVTNYYGPYDGNFHNIKIELSDSMTEGVDYAIYYSVDEPLDATNYKTAGKTASALQTACGEITYHRPLIDVKDEQASDYDVYYYIESLDGSHDDYEGQGSVTLTPLAVTVIAESASTYTKVYDGTDILSDEDKVKLRKGSYYTMTGILPEDAAKYKLSLDFLGTYNTAHVADATYVKLTGLTVVYVDENYQILPSTSVNYDYTFRILSFNVAAEITPKPVRLNWRYAEDAGVTGTGEGTNESPYIYTYTGTEQKPYAEIIKEDLISTDQDKLALDITGGMINVGDNYLANAIIIPAGDLSDLTEEEKKEREILVDDYSFTNPGSYFSITKNAIKVTVKSDISLEYDGKDHNYVVGTIGSGVSPEDAAEYFTIEGLLPGQKIYAKTEMFGANAGNYTVTLNTENVRIFSEAGTNVTSNYVITTVNGSATIEPKEITISGFAAKDKVYDGTKDVVIDYSKITLDGVLEGDDVTFDPEGHVTAEFENKNAGIDKKVSIKIVDEENALAGASKKNYVLKNTEDYDTTATIKKATLKISAESISVNYAEYPTWSASFNGIVSADQIVAGTNELGEEVKENPPLEDVLTDASAIDYKILQTVSQNVIGEDGVTVIRVDYVDKPFEFWKEGPDYRPVGDYKIRIGIDDVRLKGDFDVNYNLVIGENDKAKVTVNKRPLQIKQTDSVISKYYDGTKDAVILSKHFTLDNIPSEHSQGEQIDADLYGKYQSSDVSDSNPVEVKSFTLKGEYKDNYTIEIPADLPGEILLRTITITADNKTITYGDSKNIQNGSVVSYGSGSDEVSNSVSFNLDHTTVRSTALSDLRKLVKYEVTYDTTASDKRKVGTYTITPFIPGAVDNGGGTYKVDNKYIVTFKTGELQVEKAKVYVVVQDQEIVYNKNSALPVNKVVFHDKEDGKGKKGDAIIKYPDDPDRAALSTLFAAGSEAMPSELADKYAYETGKNYGQTVNLSNPEKTVADTYPIKVDVSPLNSESKSYYKNYEFIAVKGTLKVLKRTIKVTGVAFNSKVYDGTIDLPTTGENSQLDLSGVEITILDDGVATGTLTIDSDDTKESEAVTKSSILVAAAYKDADAGSSKNVPMTITLKEGTYLANNYALDVEQTQQAGQADITKRPVAVIVEDQTITYGESLPTEFTLKLVNVVSEDATAVTSGIRSKSVSFSCEYNPAINGKDDVRDYPVVVSSSYDNSNYTFTYPSELAPPVPDADVTYAGKLTVEAAQFTTTQPSWSDMNPGTIVFDKVTGIGLENVASYDLQLYVYDNETQEYKKVGDVVNITADGSASYSHDFSTDIRTNGPGQYKASVVAKAAGGQDNVSDSEEAGSGDLYAAKVIVKYADDADTNAGKYIYLGDYDADNKETIGNIFLNTTGTTEYVMIAGETKPSQADYRSEKGYTISATANSSKLAISDDTSTHANGRNYDSGTNKSTYYTKLALVASLNSADDITVTYKLTAAPATVTVSVYSSTTSLRYCYKEEEAPYYTATVDVVAGTDNTVSSNYIYKYEWYIQKGQSASAEKISVEETGPVMKLPTGLVQYSNWLICCKVTATRKDNGKAITARPANQKLVITKGYLEIKSLELEGWTYGEARKAPVITTSPDVTSDTHEADTYKHIPIYYYADSPDGTWTTTMPTDAGIYYLKAVVKGGDNYEDAKCPTDGVTPPTFEIQKNQLATPENLTMSASSKAPYGLISWDAVDGYEENAGVDSKSQVTVSYNVCIYAASTKEGEKHLVKKIEGVKGNSLDIAEYIGHEGFYWYTIRAMSSNTDNVLDSDESDFSAPLDVRGILKAVDVRTDRVLADESTKTKNVTKVYDGTPIRLEMICKDEEAGSTYKWYKSVEGGTAQRILEATGKTWVITYVEENATYTCERVKEGETYSAYMTVEITPRELTLTSGTDEKIYDGESLSKDVLSSTHKLDGENKTATGTSAEVLVAEIGDKVTATLSGTQTVKGVSDNLISNVVIKNGSDKVVYAEGADDNNYTIVKVEGTLTVKARPITITADSDEKIYDGKALTKSTYTYTEEAAQAGLLSESTISLNMTPASTITNVGVKDNEIEKSSIVIKNGSKEDVTDSYDITTVTGTLTVTASSLGDGTNTAANISLTALEDKIYNGAALYQALEVKDSKRASGEETLVECKAPGKTDSYYTGKPDKGDYYAVYTENVNVGTVTVTITGTGNYRGSFTATYKILPRKVVITSADKQKVYDDEPLKSETVADLQVVMVKPASGAGAAIDDAYYGNGLASTDSFAAVTFTASITDVGTEENTYKDVVIKNASGSSVNDNYDIKYLNGTLEITPATDTISIIKDLSKTYDSIAVSEPGVRGVGVTYDAKNQGTLTYRFYEKVATLPSGKTCTEDDTTVGAYVTNPTGGYYKVLSAAPVLAGEYAVKAFVSGDSNFGDAKSAFKDFVIQKRQITLTACDKSKIYDGTELTYGVYSFARQGSTGKETVSSNAAGEGQGIAGSYGEVAVANRITDGLLPGESIVASMTSDSKLVQKGSVANKIDLASVTIKNASDEDVTDSYEISTVGGTLTIQGKTVTIKALDGTWVYDGTSHTKNTVDDVEVTAGELASDGVHQDYIAAVTFTAGSIIKTVGEKDNEITSVTIKDESGNDVTASYEITLVKGKLKITSREIAVTALDAEKVYDTQPLTQKVFSYTRTGENGLETVSSNSMGVGAGIAFGSEIKSTKGLAPGHTVTVTMTADSTRTDVGETANTIQDIVITDESGNNVTANYSITKTNGVLKVTKISLGDGTVNGTLPDGITMNALEDRIYNGQSQLQTITIRDAARVGVDTLLTEGVDYTVSYDNNLNAGTATVTVTGKGNYEGSIVRTFDIAKRKLVVKSKDESKVYDGQTLSLVGTENLSVLHVKPEAGAGAELDDSYYAAETAGLVTGDVISAVTFTASITEVGTKENTYKDVIIKNAAGNKVNDNYDIQYIYGVLQIANAAEQITIDRDISKKYDGKKADKPGVNGNGVTYHEDNNGTLTFHYYEHINELPAQEIVSTDNTVPGNYVSDGNGGYYKVLVDAPVVVGDYYVKAFIAGDPNYVAAESEYTLFHITKRTLTVQAKDATKIFDGGKLTQDSFECEKETSDGLATGDDISVRMTVDSYLINVGSITNKIASVQIKNPQGEDVTGCYQIVTVDGTLTVTQRPLNKTADSEKYASYISLEELENKIYSGEAYTPSIVIKDSGRQDNVDYSLQLGNNSSSEGKDYILHYENNVNAGKAVVTITGINNYCGEIKATFTIEPAPLTRVEIDQDVFEYDGTKKGPQGVVYARLGGAQTDTVVAKINYQLTENEKNGKVTKADAVGTYLYEAVGTGNYGGSVSAEYSIVDNSSVVLKDERGEVLQTEKTYIYCKQTSFLVEDPNLVSVVAVIETKTDKDTVAIQADRNNFKDGKYEFVLKGIGEDVNKPTLYIVTVKDAKKVDISGNVIEFNETKYQIMVYPDHSFTHYKPVNDKDISTAVIVKADCDHKCGAEDYATKLWGTINWDFSYSYKVPGYDVLYEGVQPLDARATEVKVELIQNGKVIAVKYISCDEMCGKSSKNPLDKTAVAFEFLSYTTEDGDDVMLPAYDENGNKYNYELKFTTGSGIGQQFIPEINYDVQYDEIHRDEVIGGENVSTRGHMASYNYVPECFDLSWEVSLKNLPKDAAGKTIHPDKLYVKILFAYSSEATDEENAKGYQILSQQIDGHGVSCAGKEKDDSTYIYSGTYPVWKYIGASKNSYYHRIQVVGYEMDGVYYDVTNQSLKSINDNDHINHTIYYIPGEKQLDDKGHVVENGKASGVVRYELVNLMPMLVFDRNDNTGKNHAVIVRHTPKADVTADDITAVGNPKRSGYTFLGWYDAPKGGTRVKDTITLDKEIVTIYAHWEKVDNAGSDDSKPKDDTTGGTPVKKDDIEETPSIGTGGGMPEGKPGDVIETVPDIEITQKDDDPGIGGLPVAVPVTEDDDAIITEDVPDKSEDSTSSDKKSEPTLDTGASDGAGNAEDDSIISGADIETDELLDTPEEPEDGHICFWHWFIIITCIIEVLLMLIILRRREEEEYENNPEAGNNVDKQKQQNTTKAESSENDIEEENLKVVRVEKDADAEKDLRTIRMIIFLAGSIVSLVFAILGFCRYDWIAFILQMIVTSIIEYLKNKDNKEKQSDK